MTPTNNYLAIDLGATSGRSIIASYDGNKVEMTELTRFKNPIIKVGGHMFWDLPYLYNEILTALKETVKRGIGIDSIGIDTWGVDFAFFGQDGQMLGLPYCYRDPHTDYGVDKYMEHNSRREVYDKTGIQFMDFNSLFQLNTLRSNGCAALEYADKILFIPDALIFMLTGEAVCEYTIASTSQMLNPNTGELDSDILKSVGLNRNRFGRLVQPGTVIGTLTEQVREETGIGPEVKVVAIASHDTASAVASVPAKDENYAYLSCGTWSLMGIESKCPIINNESYNMNFTNEGGIEGTTRFLKNICGLWLFEQSRLEFKDAPEDIASLSALCETTDFSSIIDPDDPSFAHPVSMCTAIREYCSRTGQPQPETPAEFIRCIYLSLSRKYKVIIDILEKLSGINIERLHVIGGGSKNQYLMQMAANAIGKPVICGPAEGTAIGNVLMQIKSAGLIGTLPQMRSIVAESVDLKTYNPII